jgi:hypothetical protein
VQTEIIQLSQLKARDKTPFGEYLVVHQVLDRFQLFRALQLQDRVPGARLGQCAAALGYASRTTIEALHDRFARGEVDLDLMHTDPFDMVPEVEIVIPS